MARSTHTVCHHTETRIVVAAAELGFAWHAGENSYPLKTAEVSAPRTFSLGDVGMQRWEFRKGKLARVPGIEVPEVVEHPDPPKES